MNYGDTANIYMNIYTNLDGTMDMIRHYLLSNDQEFPLFCSSLIGRDGIYSSVPHSEYTTHEVLWCIRGFYF